MIKKVLKMLLLLPLLALVLLFVINLYVKLSVRERIVSTTKILPVTAI